MRATAFHSYLLQQGILELRHRFRVYIRAHHRLCTTILVIAGMALRKNGREGMLLANRGARLGYGGNGGSVFGYFADSKKAAPLHGYIAPAFSITNAVKQRQSQPVAAHLPDRRSRRHVELPPTWLIYYYSNGKARHGMARRGEAGPGTAWRRHGEGAGLASLGRAFVLSPSSQHRHRTPRYHPPLKVQNAPTETGRRPEHVVLQTADHAWLHARSRLPDSSP